ncbi:MAG: hypothetical protein M3042_10180 [Actinomycetota bacterium]|nr:hypothetical protein [Actinomycetota bacterium]
MTAYRSFDPQDAPETYLCPICREDHYRGDVCPLEVARAEWERQRDAARAPILKHSYDASGQCLTCREDGP